MNQDKPICCFIAPTHKSCQEEAEFIIIHGNSPDDATESCAHHIGELVDDRIERFELIRISGGIMLGDTVKVRSAPNGAPDDLFKVIRNTDGNLALDDVMGTDLMSLSPRAIQKVK